MDNGIDYRKIFISNLHRKGVRSPGDMFLYLTHWDKVTKGETDEIKLWEALSLVEGEVSSMYSIHPENRKTDPVLPNYLEHARRRSDRTYFQAKERLRTSPFAARERSR